MPRQESKSFRCIVDGAIAGQIGAILGSSRRHLGAIVGNLGPIMEATQAPCWSHDVRYLSNGGIVGHLGTSVGSSESNLGDRGPFWAHRGAILGNMLEPRI